MTDEITSKQLRLFLGELRAGADVASAGVVSEMEPESARQQAAAEKRSEYARIIAIQPRRELAGNQLRFR